MDLAERLLKEDPRERLVVILSSVINHLDHHSCKEVRQNLVRYQESNSKISIEALCRAEKVASFRAAISAEPSLKNRMGFNNLPMDKVTMLLSCHSHQGSIVVHSGNRGLDGQVPEVRILEGKDHFHC